MQDVQITNGTIKYGETRKIADFENKRADVELSFNIPEGTTYNEIVDRIQAMAKNRCQDMLRTVGCSPALAAPFTPQPEHLVSDALKQPLSAEETKPPRAKRAPKMPEPVAENTTPNLRTETVVDPAAMEEPPALLFKAGDVIGTTDGVYIAQTTTTTLITDADMMDATTKCQTAVKNAPAIRKLLNDLGVKTPPGRLIDLPQVKRQQYLDGLKLIKPLA